METPVSTTTPTGTPVPSSTPTETSLPPTAQPTSMEAPVTLRRGINLGNMLEAPQEGEWGIFVEEEYFDLIQEAGFDFVRLPVRWSAHTTYKGHDDGDVGHVIDPAFFARVDEVVGWALERNLAVILDFHHDEEMMADPNLERFLFIWKQIGEHYAEESSQVVFELLNEPGGQLNASLWNIYIQDGLKVIRETNPTRQIVIGPVQWYAYDWVSTLDVPDDEHIIVTFHYYLPFEFTHQGADWVGEESKQWLGKTWEGNEVEKAQITAHFESVADWARRKHVRILLGEFGVYSQADPNSRVRWTAFVRGEAERLGFAWAYWEFGSDFGAYDLQAKAWREGLLRALIP